MTKLSVVNINNLFLTVISNSITSKINEDFILINKREKINKFIFIWNKVQINKCKTNLYIEEFVNHWFKNKTYNTNKKWYYLSDLIDYKLKQKIKPIVESYHKNYFDKKHKK